jgi:hypothetical protein
MRRCRQREDALVPAVGAPEARSQQTERAKQGREVQHHTALTARGHDARRIPTSTDYTNGGRRRGLGDRATREGGTMSAARQTVFATLIWETCCHEGCGISFGLEKNHRDQLLEKKNGFFCPNGHRQYYTGQTEAERLKKELEQEQKRRHWIEADRDRAREERDRQERRARAYKAVATKTKKRVGNGVCPCCDRTFQNLLNHMKTQHPEYKDGEQHGGKKGT